VHNWQETAVKVHLAGKTLQLLDVLGGGEDLIAAAWPAVGADPVAEIMWPRISRVGTEKTHFLRLICETIGGQSFEKSFQMKVCLPVREPTRESSMYANKPSRPSTCGPSCAEKSVQCETIQMA
jgi:hypothetical protein